MIIKTTWRSNARTPDSDIYLSIEQPTFKGQAKFQCGGDVKFPGYAGCTTPMQNLRSHVHKLLREHVINPPRPVLHRLVLGTVGRPMWAHKSDRDLLTGFRDALQAHNARYEKAILHRDISASNILLIEMQNVGLCGFITDFDFACIKNSTIRKGEVTVESIIDAQNRYENKGNMLSTTDATTCTHTTFESTVTVKRGAVMTGTAQFMARTILLQEVDSNGDVVHEATHDVESFIWVLSYCVMGNLCDQAFKSTAQKEVWE
ncbi:hypothetical protein BDZ97DRAFT_358403 [Flammula alnicola]|nr:hypothetical protein BDZ97DRAFT_358403 [Flammula alnicola]